MTYEQIKGLLLPCGKPHQPDERIEELEAENQRLREINVELKDACGVERRIWKLYECVAVAEISVSALDDALAAIHKAEMNEVAKA